MEMQLLMPAYNDNAYNVAFGNPLDNSLEEVLPDDILGAQGGAGTSYFRTSAESEEIDGTTVYDVYALRFMGTKQRSAYCYSWHNLYSETDAYLSIRIKAVADDNCTLDDIADNDAYWSNEYVEIQIPACGSYLYGMVFLAGYDCELWTSSEGAFDQQNPSVSEYAVSMTAMDTYAYLTDARKDNSCNLRLVEAD